MVGMDFFVKAQVNEELSGWSALTSNVGVIVGGFMGGLIPFATLNIASEKNSGPQSKRAVSVPFDDLISLFLLLSVDRASMAKFSWP